MVRSDILEKYIASRDKYSDIFFHLPKLYEYALKCTHVTEMGVRFLESTWAFLLASADCGCKVVSYDIEATQQVIDLQIAHTDWLFIEGDTTKVEIHPTEMLFIDTLHTYDQLKKELELHANKVSKYIAAHDIHSFGFHSENGDTRGLLLAIHEFLIANTEWEMEYYTPINNGLCIIKRK